ncbi:MAG: hypothetical protein MUC36_20170 [Planctomycetes bacterium]|nr:hypothetical protein [Planctomycetota bacterium]
MMIALATVAAALLAQRGFVRRYARARLPARLASPDPHVVARAASEIARDRSPGFEPALLRTLKTWSARNDHDAAVVCLFVLDALIRTDAVVPAAALKRLLHGVTEVAAFVLMARSPTLNELELLASFRDHGPLYGRSCRDLRWVAEGNLLCQHRTPGFAGLLLRDLEWSLAIEVKADGAESAPCGIEVQCLSAAGDQLGGHAGYPALPAYSLLPAAEGGTLLADGPVAVACRRALARPNEPCGKGITNLDRRLRAAWLERLVDGIEVRPEQAVAITDRDGRAVDAAIERCCAEFHAGRRRLLSALAAAGALTPAEVVAASRPVRLLVHDGRGPGAVPLASLADPHR